MFHFYFRFLAAIFDLRLTPTLHSVNMSPFGFLDRKNSGLVLGFPLVPLIEAETKIVHTCFRHMAAILISGLDTIVNRTSSKYNLDDLPFNENRIKQFLSVPKIEGGFGSPPPGH